MGRSFESRASARRPGRCISVVPSGSGIIWAASSLTRVPPERPAGRNPPRTSISPSGRATMGRIPRFSPSAAQVNLPPVRSKGPALSPTHERDGSRADGEEQADHHADNGDGGDAADKAGEQQAGDDHSAQEGGKRH